MASPQIHTRPDLAAMQATLPTKAGPNPVDMQAAAQAGQQPYVEFDGVRFYLARQVDLFDLAELGEAIDGADANPMPALGVMNRCYREWITDYPALRARFRARYPGTDQAALEAWATLAQDIFAAVTARPTEAPASSSPGREPTSTSSKVAPGSPDPAWSPPASHG